MEYSAAVSENYSWEDFILIKFKNDKTYTQGIYKLILIK